MYESYPKPYKYFRSFFYHKKQNKENFDDLKFLSRKQIDEDAQSSHSDCMIIESDIPSSTLNDVSNKTKTKVKYIYIYSSLVKF
jgi:hypothetical protein